MSKLADKVVGRVLDATSRAIFDEDNVVGRRRGSVAVFTLITAPNKDKER